MSRTITYDHKGFPLCRHGVPDHDGVPDHEDCDDCLAVDERGPAGGPSYAHRTPKAQYEAGATPDYYRITVPDVGVVTPFDLIEALSLNFNRGCVVKYALRAGRKSATTETEDLKKARSCLDREINRLERGQ